MLPATTPTLLTVPETARVLRVHRATIYRLVRSGSLPIVRIGHSIRIDSGQLERWICGEDRDAA